MYMKIAGAIVVIIAIAAGVWFYMGQTENTPEPAPVTDTTGGEPITNTMPAMMADVVYSDTGFSPAEVILPLGGTVTWKNESKVNMWVATAMHPTHAVYDGTNLAAHCKDGKPTSTEVFDQCVGVKPGESWSFTFTKEGDWKYHDHITTGRFGSIKVEQIQEMVVDGNDQSAQ